MQKEHSSVSGILDLCFNTVRVSLFSLSNKKPGDLLCLRVSVIPIIFFCLQYHNKLPAYIKTLCFCYDSEILLSKSNLLPVSWAIIKQCGFGVGRMLISRIVQGYQGLRFPNGSRGWGLLFDCVIICKPGSARSCSPYAIKR